MPFLLVLLALFASIALATVLSPAQGVGSVGIDRENARMRIIQQAVQSRESTMDRVKAILLATSSPEFQALASGHSPSFNSIFTTWSDSYGANGVTVIWNDINVVYSYSFPNGSAVNIVSSENPGLDTVVSVTTQRVQSRYASTRSSNLAGGYEFYEWGNGPTNPIWDIDGHWTVPSASQPYSTTGASCDYNQCDFAPWLGLVNAPGGAGSCGGQNNGCIVQAGSDSGLYCYWFFGYQCTYSHWAWYELVPNSPVHCWDDIGYGNSMYADVLSERANGPWGDPNTYEIFLTDDTLSRTCHMTPQGYSMGTPWYGEAVGERPHETLNGFSTYPMRCQVNAHYSPNGYNTCYQLYSNGNYIQDYMVNCAYLNIGTSAVDSTSTFTTSYSNSNCT